MNTVKEFLNDKFGEIRVVAVGENMWFVAADICSVLGLSNPSKSLENHKEGKDKTTLTISYSGNMTTNVLCISEQGLYKLIFKSRKPFAEEFQDWICGEVIPSIRKNGGYIDKQEELSPEEILAKALLVAQNVIDSKEKKIQEQSEEIEYKGKLIDVLSEETTTIHGSREKINKIIRKIASAKYSNLFGKCWKEFYSVLRYEHHIGNKVKEMNETQLEIAYKTAVGWASKLNIEIKESL